MKNMYEYLISALLAVLLLVTGLQMFRSRLLQVVDSSIGSFVESRKGNSKPF